MIYVFIYIYRFVFTHAHTVASYAYHSYWLEAPAIHLEPGSAPGADGLFALRELLKKCGCPYPGVKNTCFHIIGDRLINPIVGVYISIMRILGESNNTNLCYFWRIFLITIHFVWVGDIMTPDIVENYSVNGKVRFGDTDDGGRF